MHTIVLKFLPGRSRAILRPSRASHGNTFRVWLVTIVDMLLVWQERASQRHTLAGLDDRLLRDMGLNRADVAREVGKPFWRA
jgi:uncharacterized protein YjiS (DUF1127 family)